MRIAINGFGRIGRTLTRVIQDRSNIELIAINDLGSVKNLAHLLKYDSIHGRFPKPIEVVDEHLVIDGQKIRVLSESDPSKLPWKDLDIDIVIESTGHFRTTKEAQKHLDAGSKKVIISAPAADLDTKTIVMGINDGDISSDDRILSNASCTTNSAAPLIHVLEKHWTIEQAYITTVHSYTSDQRLHDAPHKDWRRGRAGAQSIVPTTTGAAKAITRIFPHLDEKIGGAGIRVPVPNGSLTDLSCIVKENPTIEEINEAFQHEAYHELMGILEYTEDPIVSIDIIGNTHSCVFDSQLTSVLGKMVKVVGWYDNEMGYCNRIVDMIDRLDTM
ncbi:MAG: type I glyceraldehyde-3-phosphate dehydrogenase [Salibacteraceae bacterium]